MAAKSLTPVIETNLAAYAYPDGAEVLNVQNEDGNYHIIFSDANVASVLTATDGTGFGNAPVGTVINQYTSGAAQIHMKEVDGTWTSK